ncbi:MAG: Tol-Pal system beta propeller repeat protein TolB [Deltaproteobacteria bacterium]|nr:Tol-Pal system beta propeller repeat protein TolB [Deltaproteobacteria bacterium]
MKSCFPTAGFLMRAFFMILLLVMSVPASAKIYLDINAPTFRRLPVAIQVFKNLSPGSDDLPLGKELHQTLSDDLEFSGLFQVLDPVSFIEDPAHSEIDPRKIRFEDWRVVGADALIEGTYQREGDRVKVEFYLYDVYLRKRILGKRYYGEVKDLRKMAHRFANAALRQITGERGVFDTRIVYLAALGKTREIHIMDYDGHNDQVLLKESCIIISPRWSSDGEKVVFTSYRDGNPDLYQITLRSGEVRKISGKPGINTGGAYSPGGGRLAYVMSKDGNSEIYTLGKYSRKPKRLTNNWAIDVAPRWSPDGKKIIFMSDRAGSPQVYLMDSDGKHPFRLTYRGKYNADPVWSPRGDRIAFASMVNGRFQIATIKPDKSGMVLITANAGNNEFPSWSPDGRFLCFSSTMDGKSDIYIMNADGTHLRRVTSGAARNSAPDWSPRFVPE